MLNDEEMKQIKTAVEIGALVPVRCIRIHTNIDMTKVRFNSVQYNIRDLDVKICVTERNQLIVDTYCEYVKDKPTVVFCASVRHAEEIAGRFQESGVDAACVSGATRSMERRRILSDYEDGRLPVLCACDLLNEGWDSPHTQVLFMARPTMSKTIYMQQLGRGMRKSPGKEYLMVFDFVDNANLFNMPYSLHRVLGLSDYVPGGLVLGTKQSVKFDQDLFRQGRKPEALVDYPVHVLDFETVDLFNWQDKVKDMVSQIAFTQMVSVQSETVERYIREGKIVPDLEVPVSGQRSFRFFEKETVRRYARDFGWTLITRENIKEIFMERVETMTMSYSYKPVFLIAFLNNMDATGSAKLADVAADFAAFYEDRVKRGLKAEKKPCIFTRGGYRERDVEDLILRMPFRRFEDMHAMRHAKQLGTLQFYKELASQMTDADYQHIREVSEKAIRRYFASDQESA